MKSPKLNVMGCTVWCNVILEFRIALYYSFLHINSVGFQTSSVLRNSQVSLLKNRYFAGVSLIVLMNVYWSFDCFSGNYKHDCDLPHWLRNLETLKTSCSGSESKNFNSMWKKFTVNHVGANTFTRMWCLSSLVTRSNSFTYNYLCEYSWHFLSLL